MKKTELRIVINSSPFHCFWVEQRASFLHFYQETKSVSGKTRITLVGELRLEEVPEFVEWLSEKR